MKRQLSIPILLSLSVLGVFVGMAFFAGELAPYSPIQAFESSLKTPPLWSDGGDHRFMLGTDDLGRDLFSRIIFGARVSLGIGFLVVVISAVFGSLLGLLAGLMGGWVDTVITRGVDILMAIPSLLLAIIVVALLGPSLFNTVMAVSFVGLPGFIRVVRAAAMSEKTKPYIEAAHGFGVGPWRLAVIEILPNCMAPLLVQATLGFSDGILNAAALGFLGLGVQPPTPEWGVMLADGRSYVETAWWLVTLPGLCLLLVVLAFNLLGDRLQQIYFPSRKV